jgi:hypothetical protein
MSTTGNDHLIGGMANDTFLMGFVQPPLATLTDAKALTPMITAALPPLSQSP